MIAKRNRMEQQIVNRCNDIVEDMSKEFMNNLGNILEIVAERNADEKKSDESSEHVVNEAACSTEKNDCDEIHRNEWSEEGGLKGQDVDPLDFEVDSDLDMHMS